MSKDKNKKNQDDRKLDPKSAAAFTDDPGDTAFINPTGGSSKKEQVQKSKTPALDSFGRDLTKLASEGKIDPIIGREREIERVAQILGRRKKNNVLLIGDAGVGKCVTKNSIISIRHKETGKIEEITIEEFNNMI